LVVEIISPTTPATDIDNAPMEWEIEVLAATLPKWVYAIRVGVNPNVYEIVLKTLEEGIWGLYKMS
jgi:hypothetical protein